MRRIRPFILACLVLFVWCCRFSPKIPDAPNGSRVIYDFSFADAAIRFLETGDSAFLSDLARLKATAHLMNHARKFHYDVPTDTTLALATFLVSPRTEKRKILTEFKRNVQFARDSVAGPGLPEKICLEYLPAGFRFNSQLFYTFGYDLGVVFGPNSSVNLAHRHYIEDPSEIRYYSIHELHHAGFVTLKDHYLPSLDISTYREMTGLIAYFTHLEGMATYAALAIRKHEGRMSGDPDYVVLQDSLLMNAYEKEYFDIYRYFKDDPERKLTGADWQMIAPLSGGKRLWYRVGACMAARIDGMLGRDTLTAMIPEPSENFIERYLAIRQKN